MTVQLRSLWQTCDLQQGPGAKNQCRKVEVALKRSRMRFCRENSHPLQVFDQVPVILSAWSKECPYLSSATDGDPCCGAVGIMVNVSQEAAGRSQSPVGKATVIRR